jgi:hydrogenase maturation protease
LTRRAGGDFMDLVIGYGNDLRGDDAAGRLVVGRVAGRAVAGAEILSVHQLTPELATQVAGADRIVFVDAYVATPGDITRVERVTGDGVDPPLGHVGGPHSLLRLSETLYGRRPDAWMVMVPALGFDFGADPSSTTLAGIADAVAHVEGLLAGSLAPSEETQGVCTR